MTFVSFAQNYEDVMLWRALKDVSAGFYVDVGANDPDQDSVTRAFYERGWSGINIEPVAAYHEKLSRSRPRDVNLQVAAGIVEGERTLYEIPGTGLSTLDADIADRHRASGMEVRRVNVHERPLGSILAEYATGDIHFLKIDVEGAELDVLAGADFVRQRPWIVVVEATAPLTRIPSHKTWEHFLAAADYVFAYFDGLNRYYVASERSNLAAFIGPPSAADDFVRAVELVARNPDLPAAAHFDPALHSFLGLTDPEPTLSHPTSQLCTHSQFREPEYRRWCETLGEPQILHRKQWEHVFLLEALDQHGMLVAGRRGLGFGCGKEPIAAVVAARGCEVVATDLDSSSAQGKGWMETSQHASSLEDLNDRGICDPELFRRQVTFRPEDMNRISADLADFDFLWSSCAFEHLGSLQNGLRFVREAMRCLKPGGVAVHTTEFNLNSNFRTIESPGLVLYRKCDILELIRTLERAGHKVAALNLNPGSRELDCYVDRPPYASEPHLKLMLDRFVFTSLGLIVRRGTRG